MYFKLCFLIGQYVLVSAAAGLLGNVAMQVSDKITSRKLKNKKKVIKFDPFQTEKVNPFQTVTK